MKPIDPANWERWEERLFNRLLELLKNGKTTAYFTDILHDMAILSDPEHYDVTFWLGFDTQGTHITRHLSRLQNIARALPDLEWYTIGPIDRTAWVPTRDISPLTDQNAPAAYKAIHGHSS